MIVWVVTALATWLLPGLFLKKKVAERRRADRHCLGGWESGHHDRLKSPGPGQNPSELLTNGMVNHSSRMEAPEASMITMRISAPA
jgi:hypothetical protein